MMTSAAVPSLTFFPVAPFSATLKSPFSSAPDKNMLEAQRRAIREGLIPSAFRGRVGLLLLEQGEKLRAFFAFEPLSPAEAASWPALSRAAVWPGLEDHELPSISWKNAAGEEKSLRHLLDELFAPFPDRDEDHGGKEQRETRAKWRGFMAAAARSPSVRLLAAKNRGELGDGPIRGLGEWWWGEAPQWQIRFEGSFIAPRSGARFLFDWMLQGLPHEARETVCRDQDPVLPILYEDDVIVAVNKPARLASVVGGRETVSAESLLTEALGKVYVVHRLDMGTSGVLVFAKNPEVHRALNAAFRAREVEKHYVARLEGTLNPSRLPKDGRVTLPLMLDWFERPKQCVFPLQEGGREALTLISPAGEVETRSGRKSIVNLYPVTGRTHQLRVHCAHPWGLGLPIDGDPFYGREGLSHEAPERRLCLHAAGVTLEHPLTKARLEIKAEVQFPDF
ncbi:ribosomal large subunit pseudouridine synthase A [gut metagenome]|uniref:Ribosomal large subunit pseudouridine synthase A n=1 Tax=gut metagenome TaxID=749906 RepID=J9DA74_9ZZZZ